MNVVAYYRKKGHQALSSIFTASVRAKQLRRLMYEIIDFGPVDYTRVDGTGIVPFYALNSILWFIARWYGVTFADCQGINKANMYLADDPQLSKKIKGVNKAILAAGKRCMTFVGTDADSSSMVSILRTLVDAMESLKEKRTTPITWESFCWMVVKAMNVDPKTEKAMVESLTHPNWIMGSGYFAGNGLLQNSLNVQHLRDSAWRKRPDTVRAEKLYLIAQEQGKSLQWVHDQLCSGLKDGKDDPPEASYVASTGQTKCDVEKEFKALPKKEFVEAKVPKSRRSILDGNVKDGEWVRIRTNFLLSNNRSDPKRHTHWYGFGVSAKRLKDMGVFDKAIPEIKRPGDDRIFVVLVGGDLAYVQNGKPYKSAGLFGNASAVVRVLGAYHINHIGDAIFPMVHTNGKPLLDCNDVLQKLQLHGVLRWCVHYQKKPQVAPGIVAYDPAKDTDELRGDVNVWISDLSQYSYTNDPLKEYSENGEKQCVKRNAQDNQPRLFGDEDVNTGTKPEGDFDAIVDVDMINRKLAEAAMEDAEIPVDDFIDHPAVFPKREPPVEVLDKTGVYNVSPVLAELVQIGLKEYARRFQEGEITAQQLADAAMLAGQYSG